MAAISTTAARTRNTLSLARSILFTGLAIGALGGVEFAVFYFTVAHMPPETLYQFIAAALLGPSAFAGGYMTALLGVLLHFAISMVVAGVFLVAAARFRFLRGAIIPSALIYGSAVNLFMGAVVLPLTALPKMPLTLPLLLNGLIGDAFFIGVPLIVTVWGNTHTVTISPKAWLDDTRVAAA